MEDCRKIFNVPNDRNLPNRQTQQMNSHHSIGSTSVGVWIPQVKSVALR